VVVVVVVLVDVSDLGHNVTHCHGVPFVPNRPIADIRYVAGRGADSEYIRKVGLRKNFNSVDMYLMDSCIDRHGKIGKHYLFLKGFPSMLLD
jgi:hypothetical protein